MDSISKEFVYFLETLSPSDWKVQVTPSWSVKDVVAHLVGWEKESVKVLRDAWESGKRPWFLDTDNYEEFSARSVAALKKFPPQQLLSEWKRWQEKLEVYVSVIGRDRLFAEKELYGWVLDRSRYGEYFAQIKKALGK